MTARNLNPRSPWRPKTMRASVFMTALPIPRSRRCLFGPPGTLPFFRVRGFLFTPAARHKRKAPLLPNGAPRTGQVVFGTPHLVQRRQCQSGHSRFPTRCRRKSFVPAPQPWQSCPVVCRVSTPRLPLASRARPRTRRLDPAGNRRSSMTAFGMFLARRDREHVRLFTRHGTDFTARYPAEDCRRAREPVGALMCARRRGDCCQRGRALGLRPNSLSASRSRRRAVAFDLIELDGEDARWQPVDQSARPCSPICSGALAQRDSVRSSIQRAMAQPFSSTPAPSAVRASSRSGSARTTDPAGSIVGWRRRTRPHRR